MKYLNCDRKHLKVPQLLVLAMALGFSSAASHAYVYSGVKWGSQELGTSGGVITWSLTDITLPCDGGRFGRDCVPLASFMPRDYDYWGSQIESAFDVWEAAADIDFLQIVDDGRPFDVLSQTSDIRISGDAQTSSRAYAHFPGTFGSLEGDIRFALEP